MAEARPTPDSDLSRSILMGSEVEFDFTCQPCSEGGKNVEAEGYCKECTAYLCAKCINYHKVLPGTAHHQLMDKDSMPQTMEAAVGLEDSERFKKFQKKLEGLIEKSKDAIKHGQESLERATDNYTRVLQEVEAYEQEIVEKLGQLKSEIKAKISSIKKQDTNKMNSISAEGNTVLADLETMSKDILEHLSKNHFNKMFVQMKNTEQKLSQLEERLRGLNDNFESTYRFQYNVELQSMLEKKDALGELLVRQPEEITAKHVTDIKVKTWKNWGTCWIAGAVLLSTRHLVVTDWKNETIKLIDTETKKILSELKLESNPSQVTKVDDVRVATTLHWAEKILLLRYDKVKGLEIEKEIKMDAICQGIAYFQDKFVVSFRGPAEVRILNLRGDILQTFATDEQGGRLFQYPIYIAADAYTQNIYVSDWERHSVTVLDNTGQVKTVYTNGDLRYPEGLVVDNVGMVYVCDVRSHNVHLLTGDCRKVKVLLSEADGLKKPAGLCYCEKTRRLYIGMLDQDVVKVYQLT